MRWLVTLTLATCGAFANDFGDLPLVLFIGNRPRPVHAKIPGRFRIELCTALFHCVAQIDYSRQLLVFDLYEVGGVLSCRECLCDDHCDRVPDVHHLFARQ